MCRQAPDQVAGAGVPRSSLQEPGWQRRHSARPQPGATKPAAIADDDGSIPEALRRRPDESESKSVAKSALAETVAGAFGAFGPVAVTVHDKTGKTGKARRK